MPKNLLQDMVKIKHSRNEVRNTTSKELEAEEVKKEDRGKSQYTLWFVAIISVVFFLFALSYLFSNAIVTVNPKTKNLVLNENLSASKNGNADVLSFDLVVISGEENKTVQATEQKNISQKATGKVRIYNNFSSSPQKLNIDTRLEGSNGKIYKTETSVIVPGKTINNNPGLVEVGIYGAEAGEEYNSTPLDFKIFGFKGTPKYSKFYARSKEKITGGLKGKFPIIPDSEKASVVNELKAVLQTKLFKKATDQIPNGFILFKDAVFLNTDDNNIDFTSLKDNMLPIKLKGTLYGLLFNENKLTKKIAENNIEKYDGSEIFMPNIRDLTFSLSSKDNVSLGDIKNINFNLSGATKIVWKFDGDKLASELLGKSKKDFNQILLQYPNIDSADLVLSPVWRRSVPDKIKDIKVIVNYPK